MKHWRRVLILALIAGLGLLIVWRIAQKSAEVAGQKAQRAARMNGPALVTLAAAQVRDISQTFEATGSVEAPLSVKIAPKITGRIDYLVVHEGDRIRKGQVLVRIDSTEVEANVQQAMANLAEAQYRLAQAQMTQNPTDVGIATQIRQQKASVTTAEADHVQTRETLKAELAAASANLSDARSRVENAERASTAPWPTSRTPGPGFSALVFCWRRATFAAQDFDDAKAALTVQEDRPGNRPGGLKSAVAVMEAAEQQVKVVKSKGDADVAASHARLLQAKASLEYAQANTSQKSAYRQSIAALQASVDAARASLKSAQSKRRDTVLTSPLDGYVTGRYADPGAIASPTQPILSVQFMRQVWVSAAVPEEVCSRLHIGGPALVRLDAFPDRTSARVSSRSTFADTDSRKFTARAILSNPDGLFKPGMFAHVSFETDRISGATVVPREAVQRDKSGAYVIIVDGASKARRKPVVTDGEDDKFISVGESLRPGQKVVIMSAMPIKEGQSLVSGADKPRGSGSGSGGSR